MSPRGELTWSERRLLEVQLGTAYSVPAESKYTLERALWLAFHSKSFNTYNREYFLNELAEMPPEIFTEMKAILL